MNLIEKVFGTHSERELKLIRPIVDKILGMREQMVALSDDELRDNTRKFKERLANGWMNRLPGWIRAPGWSIRRF